VKFKEI